MKSIICITLMLIATSSIARVNGIKGDWGSGGGNALVCFQNTVISEGDQTYTPKQIVEMNKNTIPDYLLKHIESIEMFDLYEAKKRRGISSNPPEIIKINSNEKIYDYFDRLSKRFTKRVDFMEAMVKEGKKLIPDTQLIFHEYAVEYQNDLGNVTLPSQRCVISTIAAQVNENNHYSVHIDERLYNHKKHTYQSKATLILHELVYGLFRKFFNHTTSGATRSIVQYLISYHDSFTEGHIAKVISDLGLILPESSYGEEVDSNYNSEIMIEIYHSVEYYHQLLVDHINHLYSSSQNITLLNEIQAQFTAEGLGDISVVKASFSGEKKMIETGIDNSTSQEKWFDFRNRFDLMIKELGELNKVELVEYKNELLGLLNTNTHISTEDLAKFKMHFDYFFEDYTHIHDWEWFESEILEWRDSRRKVFKRIWWNFTVAESCESDVILQSQDMKRDPECYGPLLLNNIIPRA